MLSYSAIVNMVERFKYKPDSLIRVERSPNTDHYCFTVAHKVPDVNDPNKLDYVRSQQILAPHFFKTEHEVILIITSMIKRLEMHEIDEWLKFDGVCLNSPHPESKK